MDINRIATIVEHYKNKFGIDANILQEIIENVAGEVVVNQLKPLHLDFETVKACIDKSSETGDLMAKIVLSVYRDTVDFSLKGMSNFDRKNNRAALAVMNYRHEKGWEDEKFYELYKYAKQALANR